VPQRPSRWAASFAPACHACRAITSAESLPRPGVSAGSASCWFCHCFAVNVEGGDNA
jgi:hypothetical protein